MSAHQEYGCIDIFVICYKRTPFLERCLESIRESTGAIQHRIVVVEGQRSAAENRNAALAEVNSPWFVMMDDDVVVTPGWLEGMLMCAEEGVGQVQPKILFPGGRIFSAEKTFTTPWGADTLVGTNDADKGQFDYVRVVEMLSGTCCLYNRKVLDGCAFDTRYEGTQWEDCDFSMQIRQMGLHLVYYGKSAVYHHNLFRNAKSENNAYFKEKWFGKRDLTRRGVLTVGPACDPDCLFCDCRQPEDKRFWPLRELEAQCDKFKVKYRNTDVDISGGEPAIYPEIVPLVAHCSKIGLKPTLITHAQRLTAELVAKLRDAGLEDVLISYHGPAKVHDCLTRKKGGYERMRAGIASLAAAGVPFRTDTVVTKQNYEVLPQLAGEFVELKPRLVKFIMFNPFEERPGVSCADFQVRYCDAAPYLAEAVRLLAADKIEVRVRYLPFCQFPGLEKHVMNFLQMPYDKWEWDFKEGEPLRDEYHYLYYATKESRARYDHVGPCRRCSLQLICSGLPKQYAREFGSDELKPLSGLLVRDPLHFQTRKATAAPPRLAQTEVAPYSVSDLVTMYPRLKDSDPLIKYHILPLSQLSLSFRGKHPTLIRIARSTCDMVWKMGGWRLERRLPKSIQSWLRAVEQKIVSRI